MSQLTLEYNRRKTLPPRERCLEFVKMNPGRTAEEIARLTGLMHVAIDLLISLRNGRLLYTDGKRLCGVRGTPCMTWYAEGL